MKIENVYYSAESIKFEFTERRGHTYFVKMGYLPDTREYIAVRDHDPLFCLSGTTFEEAKQKAHDALKFYVEHGLEARK